MTSCTASVASWQAGQLLSYGKFTALQNFLLVRNFDLKHEMWVDRMCILRMPTQFLMSLQTWMLPEKSKFIYSIVSAF